MTSTAYETTRRRSTALRGLVDELELTRATALPWTPELAAEFDSPADLLVAVHGLWSRRLEARIDLALETGEGSPAEDVAAAWREVAATLPAVRRILDAHADAPELRASQQHEHRLVAIGAGLASPADPIGVAARQGARLIALRAARVATR